MAKLPLEGIRIIDMTIVWAGPYGTVLLGDLGAELIRVESLQTPDVRTRGEPKVPPAILNSPRANQFPNKDPGKRPWERGASFAYSGRHKRSMTVDLLRPSGKEILFRLVEKSDVFMENGAADTVEKLGTTYDVLSKVNPRIIMCSFPGYGTNGPYKYYKGYGANVEAAAGHTYLRGYPDRDFTGTSPIFHGDPAAGAAAAFHILAALAYRRRTGRGQFINLSQAEVITTQLPEAFMDYSMNRRVQERMGNRHESFIQGCYRCQGDDRWVVLTVTNDQEWKALCNEMGRPDLMTDERFATTLRRYQHHDEVDQVISAWTAPLDHYEAFQRLQARGIAAGPVLKPNEVLSDPHYQARGFYEEHFHPVLGAPYRFPGPAFDMSETPLRIRKLHPTLGEDNEYVYKQVLGYSEEEYQRFIEEKHVGWRYVGYEADEE